MKRCSCYERRSYIKRSAVCLKQQCFTRHLAFFRRFEPEKSIFDHSVLCDFLKALCSSTGHEGLAEHSLKPTKRQPDTSFLHEASETIFGHGCVPRLNVMEHATGITNDILLTNTEVQMRHIDALKWMRDISFCQKTAHAAPIVLSQ